MNYDRDIYGNALFRAEIKEVLNDDKSKLQEVLATGYDGEELKLIRLQTHGISSRPPKGSLAYGMSFNGRRENAMLIGGEMPGKRFTDDHGEGGITVSDLNGNRLTFDMSKVSMVAVGPITITNTSGQITLTSAVGVTINAPSVKMNGTGGGQSQLGGGGSQVDIGGNPGTTKRIRLEDGSLTSNVRAI